MSPQTNGNPKNEEWLHGDNTVHERSGQLCFPCLHVPESHQKDSFSVRWFNIKHMTTLTSLALFSSATLIFTWLEEEKVEEIFQVVTIKSEFNEGIVALHLATHTGHAFTYKGISKSVKKYNNLL